MSNRLIGTLSISCAVLFAAYVACMATAMFFAMMSTSLTHAAHETEIRVSALETKYYAAISALGEAEVQTLGLVDPTRVEYVAENGKPTFTRADR